MEHDAEKDKNTTKESQYDINKITSSVDTFEEQYHVIQLDIGKMFREYPSSEQLKIVVGAKGSSIRIASMELLDKSGSKAPKV